MSSIDKHFVKHTQKVTNQIITSEKKYYCNLPSNAEDVEGRVVLLTQRFNLLEEKLKTQSQLQNEIVMFDEKADRLGNMSVANELPITGIPSMQNENLIDVFKISAIL